jgi:membrane-bound lytic murein transglycosylase F
VRPLRRVVPFVAATVAAAALALWLRSPEPVAPSPRPATHDADTLTVYVRSGPIVYFPGPDGNVIGLDADLVRLFARELRLRLHFIAVTTPAEVFAALERGDADLGIGGLLRPPPPRPPLGLVVAQAFFRVSGANMPFLRWSLGYYAVEPLLIYNSDGFRPASWRDLDGETIAYVDGAGLEPEVERLRATHPEVNWAPTSLPSATELIAQVSDGGRSYAIVGSLAAAVARNIYLDFDIAFPVGARRDLAFAVSAREPTLAHEVDRFLARARRDGTLARLVERYVPDASQFLRIDALGLQERIHTVLPLYRHLFDETQTKTGLDWRLLAAVAYQESKWDSAAESATGVRGFMQLTEDTAKLMGVTNLLDPAQNVLAAAQYLRTLKDKLPARIQEPDRTWLALAAYNIGLGHLEDARILAQKQGLDPDHWVDVKKALPLLALPEYNESAKLGYARGGMPVAFVERVRGYYDVLLAHEPASQRPRLHAERVAGPSATATPAPRPEGVAAAR